jgi:hypothetical protein
VEHATVREALTRYIAEADLIVTTAAVPGRKAPRLIDRSQVLAMKPGSVIVDLAADSGGNVEGTLPGETVIVGVTAAISGWWFARNVQLYGDLLGWNAFLDVVGRRDAPATLAQLWTEREGFVWAFWGVFGTMNVIYAPWIYAVLNGGVLAAIGGALLGFVRAVRARRIDWRAAALCAAWIAAIFVALLRWTALTPASQGRLMFPAIVALALMFVYGAAQIHRAAPWAAGAALVALTAWTPGGVIAPAYARPANQWASSQDVEMPTLARP